MYLYTFVDWFNYRAGVYRDAGPLGKFAVDENLASDRATERMRGGFEERDSREPARPGSTCSWPNRAIGTGHNEGGQFTRLFGRS